MSTISNSTAFGMALVCSISIIAANSPVYAQEQNTGDTSPEVQYTSISLEAGNYFQVLAPRAKPGADQARSEFYGFVFPQAAPLGLARRGQMSVTQSLVSDYNPEAFVFLTWPNKQNFDQFVGKPEWPSVKALRPEGWDELKIYSSVIEAPMTLNFRSDKSYTVAVAWANPSDPTGYDRYMAGIADAVTEAGGRFLYKMRKPDFEAHASSPEGPLQLTIVEWDSAAGLPTLQRNAVYQANQANFQSGVSRIEFYRVKPVFPKK